MTCQHTAATYLPPGKYTLPSGAIACPHTVAVAPGSCEHCWELHQADCESCWEKRTISAPRNPYATLQHEDDDSRDTVTAGSVDNYEQPTTACARCAQPITGPAVREWTGPAGIPARGWHAACEPCAVCGVSPIVYRNFKDIPLCSHCCECSCGNVPCTAPTLPPAPARKLLDQMSDAQLTALYERAEFYEAATKRSQDRAEAAAGRANLATKRAEQAEAAITRARETADRALALLNEASDWLRPGPLRDRIDAVLNEPKEPRP